MKKITLILIGVVIGVAAIPAFGVHSNTIVLNQVGSSIPGCEETNECFIPATVAISVGDSVIWKNVDTAAHTVTSGTVTDGPDGIFDSGLFAPDTEFSHVFEEAGVYDYYCMVHPWQHGTVIVGTATTPTPIEPAIEPIHEPTTTEPATTEPSVMCLLDDHTATPIVTSAYYHDVFGHLLLTFNKDVKVDYKGLGLHGVLPNGTNIDTSVGQYGSIFTPDSYHMAWIRVEYTNTILLDDLESLILAIPAGALVDNTNSTNPVDIMLPVTLNE